MFVAPRFLCHGYSHGISKDPVTFLLASVAIIFVPATHTVLPLQQTWYDEGGPDSASRVFSTASILSEILKMFALLKGMPSALQSRAL